MTDTKRPNTWVECIQENDWLRSQVAAMPAEIVRRTKELREDRDELLEVIRELHQADTTRPDCIYCDGEGKVNQEQDDGFPTRRGGLDESTSFELVECDGCRGSKKEWC